MDLTSPALKTDQYLLSPHGAVSQAADADAILSRARPHRGSSTEPSSGFGPAFAAARWARHMVAAFMRPPLAVPPSRQELSAMPRSGSDAAASLVADARGTGTIATATEDAAALRSTHGASVATEAQATIAAWLAVDLEVSAVIGRRGTAAVLQRALMVTRRMHRWMPEPSDDVSLDACVRALGDALAGQAPEDSSAGQQALETAFHDLLSSLVGGALTTQLLHTARTALRTRIEPAP